MQPEIKVPLLDSSSWIDVEGLSGNMDELDRHPLKNESWPEFKTECTAFFSMAHSNEFIYLKFYVRDDHFKASRRAVNADVNKDNCVEFFVAFNEGSEYYNIEFNCLGVGKAAYGKDRENRTFLSIAQIEAIKVWNKMEFVDEYFNWEITLMIPTAVFEYDQLDTLKEINCRGNFYKCGDELPEPHFLSWNKIYASKPDFHKPDYFSAIKFN